nr:F0F1 ATP synthase subunit gamma [Butyrivibrio sp. AE3003]
MATIKEIRDRINSVNDTRKITNAMYLISSTKLRRAKKMLTDTEPFFFFHSGNDLTSGKTFTGRG